MVINDELTGAELAFEIGQQISRTPDAHQQAFWFRNKDQSNRRVVSETFLKQPECGTTLCVAGWAAVLNGYDVGYYEHPTGVRSVYAYKMVQGLELRFEIGDLAQDLLEISDGDAEALFCATNNREAVVALEYLETGSRIDWDDISEELADVAYNY